MLTIRLSQGGLSFKKEGAPEHFVPFTAERSLRKALQTVLEKTGWSGAGWGATGDAGGGAHVLLDSPKTVLVPTELFTATDASHYLHINNMSPTAGEEIIVAPVGDASPSGAHGVPITAIMAFNREALLAVRGAFDDEVSMGGGTSSGNGQYFGSGALSEGGLHFGTPFERVLRGAGTKIYLTGANLYAAVWREGAPVWVDMLPYTSLADLRYYAEQLVGQFPHLARARVQVSGLGARAAAGELRKIFKGVCE